MVNQTSLKARLFSIFLNDYWRKNRVPTKISRWLNSNCLSTMILRIQIPDVQKHPSNWNRNSSLGVDSSWPPSHDVGVSGVSAGLPWVSKALWVASFLIHSCTTGLSARHLLSGLNSAQLSSQRDAVSFSTGPTQPCSHDGPYLCSNTQISQPHWHPPSSRLFK